MADKERVKLIITIVDRGHGKSLARYYAKQEISCSFQCMGRGTASSELLDVLGVGSAERDILFSLAPEKKTARLLYKLDRELQGDGYGKGIVFSIPITGMSNLIAAALLQEADGSMGGVKMETKAEHSLILITVNQGHTDAVMDTAREAGAGGGTVVRARWAGEEEGGQYMGISIQAEKEIVLIVAAQDKRNAIMEMVNKKHGLKTEAGAMVYSVPIDSMVRVKFLP